MAEVITRNRIAYEANVRIRDRCNSGISWGTNSYPGGSNPGWFAGDTNGRPEALSAANFVAGVPNASQAKAVLRWFANVFGGIRLTRILIYRSHYVVGLELIYDGTAMANTIYGVGDFAAAAPLGTLYGQAPLDMSNIQSNCDELWNYYYAYCRASAIQVSNTICHTSCHSNCHCARGRR
ncbi:hypothetical protein D3C87_1193800 [compost metagenome]